MSEIMPDTVHRVDPGNMEEWRDAVDAVQNNEILGAVMRAGGDEETMSQAVIDTDEDMGWEDLVVRPSLASPDLSRAAIIAHNASVEPKYRVPEDHVLPDLSAYRRDGTQFHYDGHNADPKISNGEQAPLVQNVQAIGRVAIDLARIPTLDPEEMNEMVTAMTEEGQMTDSGNRHLRPDYGGPRGQIIAEPGDLTVFSGLADVTQGRYPVGHEFNSLGDTVEERSQRASALATPGKIREAQPPVPVGV